MKPVNLHTERLHIRQFNDEDLDACLRFRQQVFARDESQADVAAWLKWTIDSYREQESLRQPPYADYAVQVKETAECIGSAGIVPAVIPWGVLAGDGSDNLLSPEVGLFWGVLPEYRRRGFASEAAHALLDYLFHDLRIGQVVATTEKSNLASQRTMTKLGMTLFHNSSNEPPWRQVVGLIKHPRST